MIEIALYQPEIAPNAAAILRTCACLGLRAGLIEPTGFNMSDSRVRRAGMDYLAQVDLVRHASWEEFVGHSSGRRLILLTTKSATPYCDFAFRPDDILLVGRESSGVPQHVHERVDASVIIPMQPGLRSLNVSVAAAMAIGEALRQTGGFPPRG
ncbi:MAG: tRNA (cytidine(34)-2'-O)-methyltransferase [Rhodospirillales bacterium]|nr:tRNA (cytidine(34)-2'-O)-methyltransferase [Rhodospirillales bacterium]